jgi:hypothetical protein
MTSKRSQEGYLLLDNRNTPGVPDDLLPGMPAGAGRGLFEAPTYTCSHCQTVVILNPLRNRDRPYCASCDHYICDRCKCIQVASGGTCKSFKQVIDEVQEAADKGKPVSPIILLS